jgi:hypothetical protein
MNERWKLCRGASNGGASEGGTIHGATSGGQSGEASYYGVTHTGANGGGVRGLNRRDASKSRINCRGADKGGLGSRVKCGGASDGADGSESSSWPNSASGCRAIERVDCGGIDSRGAFWIFSGEQPLCQSRLHFGLDPLLKNFVQLLAQVGDPVQTGEMEGLDGSFGRSEEIFERPVDGVLSRSRVLLCVPLGARHCRQRYHTRYYRLEYWLAVPGGERGERLVVSTNADMGRGGRRVTDKGADEATVVGKERTRSRANHLRSAA